MIAIPTFFAEHIVASAVIVFLAFLIRVAVAKALKIAIIRVEDDDPEAVSALEQRAYTLGGVVRNTLNIVIYGTMMAMLLAEWGINIGPLLAGAGVVGLAVGFGAQTLVKDVVTGFFILLENQFNMGDWVEIGGSKGKVVEMNLRTTVLEDEYKARHIIPNSQVSKVVRLAKAEA